MSQAVLSGTSAHGYRHETGFNDIKRVAKHETSHLLGHDVHHNTAPAVSGYPSSRRCNMLYEVPAGNTCEKCDDALEGFWRGVEHRTGQRYRTDARLLPVFGRAYAYARKRFGR